MRNWNVNCLLQNDKSLGINMNIVSNVGQMFMFCVGSLLHHFWRCVWCVAGQRFFVHRFVSSRRSVGPRPA